MVTLSSSLRSWFANREEECVGTRVRWGGWVVHLECTWMSATVEGMCSLTGARAGGARRMVKSVSGSCLNQGEMPCLRHRRWRVLEKSQDGSLRPALHITRMDMFMLHTL